MKFEITGELIFNTLVSPDIIIYSMEQENQNIEWKESWRDEYLKWICGFANAEGGVIYIGKNDKGAISGVQNARKLLEDIPNKVKDILGIIVDVNLLEEEGKEIIEIKIEPYPYPVSYKGEYHYRSGSTKQELKGAALDKFLLQKQGRTWDAVPIPGVNLSDLKLETLQLFRKNAANSKRVSDEVLSDTDSVLIENLHLNEDKYLKRAAILLFHPEPEKYVTGAYLKIGFFNSDEDLRYQDEIHGNLFEQIEKAYSLILSKYVTANIRYEGTRRIEEYPFPEGAIREALLNAIAHKDYSSRIPVQISVYDHKIIFWNDGHLPANWTVEKLKTKHPSKPFNPDVANTLFRAGYIESWGRGTIKIIQECNSRNLPPPIFSHEPPDFQVIIHRYSKESLTKLREPLQQIILFVQQEGSITNAKVQKLLNVTKRTASRYLAELEEEYLDNTGTKGPGSNYVFKKYGIKS